MWPLIIPPLVLVLSLGFLVWFLSRKSADPALQERLAVLGQAPRPKRFLLFFKEDLGLRLLERLSQRLKLVSLKLHNRFQQLSTLLRKRREQAHEIEETALAEHNTASMTNEEEGEGFWDRWHRRHRATLEPAAPLETGGDGEIIPPSTLPPDAERITITNITPAVESSSSSRFGGLKKKMSALAPNSSEYFTRKRSIVPPRKLLSEEELIDRIAKNPKDAASYEELGDYYLQNENLEDAKACYRQVIKLSPLNREVKEKVRKLERLLVQREKQRS